MTYVQTIKDKQVAYFLQIMILFRFVIVQKLKPPLLSAKKGYFFVIPFPGPSCCFSISPRYGFEN